MINPSALLCISSTSSIKVVSVDLSGSVAGEADVPYNAYGIENGFFEQDPADWTRGIISAANMLREKLPEEQWQSVKAIGLSAQMPTMVLIEKDGEVLDRAIVWCDARAEKQGKQLLEFWGEENHYYKTGVKLDGRSIIPMYQWIREHKPELAGKASFIYPPKKIRAALHRIRTLPDNMLVIIKDI